MNYNVETIPFFDKQAKRLAKKHKSLKNDLTKLIENLEKEPKQGIDLGNNVYKIRLLIKSKGKGKSGGARVITHIRVTKKIVFLLSVFDKSEQSTITDKQIAELMKQID